MQQVPQIFFVTGKFFVIHISSIFLWLYHRSSRIQGRILFRGAGENVTPKKGEIN
jgi:hypothetical protein